MQSCVSSTEEQLGPPSSPELSRRKRFLARFLDKMRRRPDVPLKSEVHPPWFDARGVGIGLFVGLAVPISGQVVSLGLLRLIFKFNSVLAFAFTWVNNPITMLPLYYGYYCLGSLMLAKPLVMSLEDFRCLMHPIVSGGYVWESVRLFLYLGGDLLERWFVGALFVGVVVGVIGYVAGYRVCRKRCKRNALQLGIRYEHLVRKLESDAKPTQHPT